jgi:hypothetical protein
MDLRIPLVEIPALPKPAQDFLYQYGYVEIDGSERVLILCGDHAKHMNHSEKPNLLDLETNIAARDIQAGEELTCNYYLFDLDADRKLRGKVRSPDSMSRVAG